jgi:hypothetical protein
LLIAVCFLLLVLTVARPGDAVELLLHERMSSDLYVVKCIFYMYDVDEGAKGISAAKLVFELVYFRGVCLVSSGRLASCPFA